jgi:hypothetical protein
MYKNWKAICGIPDVHFMWAMALLDVTSDFAKELMTKLPEYFTTEEQKGPVPLSLLVEVASAAYVQEGYDLNEKDPLACIDLAYDGKIREKFDIPTRAFRGPSGDNDALSPLPIELLSAVEEVNARCATILEYKGKKFIIVGGSWPDSVVLAPVECIALDR